jgi:hypothetical protein
VIDTGGTVENVLAEARCGITWLLQICATRWPPNQAQQQGLTALAWRVSGPDPCRAPPVEPRGRRPAARWVVPTSQVGSGRPASTRRLLCAAPGLTLTDVPGVTRSNGEVDFQPHLAGDPAVELPRRRLSRRDHNLTRLGVYQHTLGSSSSNALAWSIQTAKGGNDVPAET